MGSEQWWSERHAIAFAKSLTVSLANANGVLLTKLTSNQLRMRDRCFEVVEEVSPDTTYFPFEKDAFLAEMERRASDMHCATKSLGNDQHRLQVAIVVCLDAPPDQPNFRT